MIVIRKRTNRFRVKLDVNAKYEDAAKSLRRLQIQPVGAIRSVDRDGKTKGEIALGVYHVKNADGEWRTLPKHQDLKALVAEYGADDYQDVY